MKGILSELKTFMIKRRRFDLAAGIVLAGAFRTVMNSLINDVILPPVSAITTGKNISSLSYVINKPSGGLPVVIGYGRFLQTMIDFLIIGVTVILILRAVDKITEKDVAKPSREQALLKEIRDLLDRQANGGTASTTAIASK